MVIVLVVAVLLVWRWQAARLLGLPSLFVGTVCLLVGFAFVDAELDPTSPSSTLGEIAPVLVIVLWRLRVLLVGREAEQA